MAIGACALNVSQGLPLNGGGLYWTHRDLKLI